MGAFAAAADILDPAPHPHATDPAGWMNQQLGEHLWHKQTDIAEALVDHRKVAVASCHDAGKSFLASRLIAWWIDTHPPGEAFVVSTAPTGHQVRGILWREIGKAHAKARGRGTPMRGRYLQTAEWKIGDELVGWGRKPKDTDEHGFQGIHARYVLVVIDEACGVPDQLWTAVEAITTNRDARILAIGNPDDPTGQFASACRPGSGWHTIAIDGLATPNVGIDTLTAAATGQLDPPLTAGQLEALLAEAEDAGTPDQAPGAGDLAPLLLSAWWIADKVRTFGVGSPAWQSKVRGRFPETAEDTLIPLTWIQQALDRTVQPEPDALSTIAVDVARFGTDETVIGHDVGGRFRILSADAAAKRTTVTAGQATKAWRDLVADEVRVDAAGVGGGVADILADDGVPTVDMQAGAAPQDGRRFLNARAEWYWGLRGRFESGDVDIDDDTLAGQLQAIRWQVDRRGRIKIESKEDARKRGMPSPDRADTLMMAAAELPDLDATVEATDHLVDISPY